MRESITELFRRGVVLPLTQNALAEIRNDSVANDDEFEVVPFSADQQFYHVWNSGVFLAINQKCNLLIDDYETTEVKSGFDVIAELCKSYCGSGNIRGEDKSTLEEIGRLALKAKSLKTSLFFVF